MRVLLLAPQPFYRERGTPIAVRLLAETLCAAGHEVDLLAFPEGDPVEHPGLRVLRCRRPPFVRDVPVGFSGKKLLCDLSLTCTFLRLVRERRYDVVHAVEEAVYPAAFFAWRHRAPVVYDMDSDMLDQLLGAVPALRAVRWPLAAVERWAVRRAALVIAVCERLAAKARRIHPGAAVRVLEDVPSEDAPGAAADDLREVLGVRGGTMALYVGNLEPYQGVDLLLEAMALVPAEAGVSLVVVGGTPADVARHRERAAALGLVGRAHFAGPRPLAALGRYLAQADVLVSPRLRGENTPMKVYSYLASGRAILATDIGSHTQALDHTCAVLVRPYPSCLAEGLQRLAADPALREALGRAGAARARERHSRESYRAKLLDAYAVLPAGARE